jgi:hypothetical protein
MGKAIKLETVQTQLKGRTSEIELSKESVSSKVNFGPVAHVSLKQPPKNRCVYPPLRLPTTLIGRGATSFNHRHVYPPPRPPSTSRTHYPSYPPPHLPTLPPPLPRLSTTPPNHRSGLHLAQPLPGPLSVPHTEHIAHQSFRPIGSSKPTRQPHRTPDA